MPKKERKKDMNTEVIPKAAYSNGLQETGQDGVVFTMPASRKKLMSVDIRPDIDTLVFSRQFIYKSTENPIRRNNNIPCYVVGWG